MSQFFGVPFPLTEFHKTMTELTVTPIEAWLRDFVSNHIDKVEVEYPCNEVYTYFKDWIKHNMPNYECNYLQFGVRLTVFNKELIKTKKTKTHNHRVFNIPELQKILFN